MHQISVIIPNYNGIKYLNDCLCALYEQESDAPDFEVIVVDNGSTDGSIERAKELISRRKREEGSEDHPNGCCRTTRILRLSSNTGFCHAVNVGIRASKAPYVLLLNNDTKVYPGFVKALYEAAAHNPRICAVSAQMLMWDQPDRIDDAGDEYCVLGWAYARGKGKSATGYGKRTEVFSACGGAALYRRSILNRIGLFDELHFAYLEDLDLGYRARIHGYINVYEPKAKVLHYGSASTGSRYNETKTKLSSANNVYVIWKNMPLLQLLWNLPFLIVGFFVKWLFFCRKGMGRIYLKGLGEGCKRCLSKEAAQKKVWFRKQNLRHYFHIQLLLYRNTLRLLSK